MNFQKNKIYNNFKLTDKKNIKEINSTALIFEHIKTKTQLIKLANNDNEKSFIITFKTIPFDDTGTAHILEHSVLNGSKKFPLKDPFATLNKSSILTFSNAFTFPDKTSYPFSTTNTTEFFKIMEIYLDSVFNPNVLNNKKIFLQEGWRYVYDKKNDKLQYSGVVFNEMLGSSSSINQLIEVNTFKYLFPENNYKYNSGGEPLNIIKLNYKKFIQFYHKYYHPTNAYIYLYGDGDTNKELEFIDKNYLSNYNYKKLNFKIEKQNSFKKKIIKQVKYPILKKNDKKKTYFSYNFVISQCDDLLTNLSLEILSKVLLENNSSILKKKIIENKLCEEVEYLLEDEIQQPYLQINLINADYKKKEKFEQILYETLNNLYKNGIDKNLLISHINNKEFELKEQIDFVDNLPKGIMFGRRMLKTWIHNKNPLIYFNSIKELEKIKSKLNENYFEKLIDKLLIKNNHKLFLILKPDDTKNFNSILNQKLEKAKQKMTTEELNSIIKQEEELKKFQNQLEKKEDLDTIKIINKNQINSKPINHKIKKINFNNFTIYQYKEQSNGITYLNFLFSADIIEQKHLYYLGLISDLLYEIKTKKYDYEELKTQINKYTGGINFNNIVFKNKKNNLKNKFMLSIKFLETNKVNQTNKTNKNKIIDILNEIFNNIIFEEEKIYEIMTQIKTRMELNFIENGHIIGINRLHSYFDETGHLNEIYHGIKYYEFINDLLKNYSNYKKQIMQNIQNTYKKIFNKKNLILNINSKEIDFEILQNIHLTKTKYKKNKYNFNLKKSNEAIIIPTKTNYVVKGFNFKKLNYQYKGELLVLQNYLKYSYLWHEIRLKSGAYGQGNILDKQGLYALFSYRDPNIKSTLKTYDKIADITKHSNFKDDELKRLIIGTISRLDLPLEINQRGLKETINKLKGIKYSDIKKERKEVLNTTNKKLQNLHKMLKTGLKKNYICVIGSQNLIEENKQHFKKIKTIE